MVLGSHYSMYGGKYPSTVRNYFGFGRTNIGGECTCGRENRCAGREPKKELYLKNR